MRFFQRAALLIPLALAACGHDLATPSGRVMVFNPGQWEPTAGELKIPTRPAP